MSGTKSSTIERLEDRRLLTATLSRGVWEIHGDTTAKALNDIIVVQTSVEHPDRLSARINDVEVGTALVSQLTQIQIKGGRGDDEILVVLPDDSLIRVTVLAGPGDDRVEGGGEPDVFYGGAGDDMLIGNGSGDTLWGQAGNDTLSGGAGADALHGGRGDDELTGGAGADKLWGDDGADHLFSDPEDPTLSGGTGRNVTEQSVVTPDAPEEETPDPVTVPVTPPQNDPAPPPTTDTGVAPDDKGGPSPVTPIVDPVPPNIPPTEVVKDPDPAPVGDPTSEPVPVVVVVPATPPATPDSGDSTVLLRPVTKPISRGISLPTPDASGAYNVKDFGAHGDGITDDTGAIDTAIKSLSQIGGTIYFPAGIYSVSNRIVVASGVTLRGAGDASVIQPALNGWTYNAVLFDLNNVHDAALMDMKIDCRGNLRQDQQFVSQDVYIHSGSENCTVQNITFYASGLPVAQSHPGGPAVNVLASSDNTIRNCRFIQPGSESTAAQYAFAIRINGDIAEATATVLAERNTVDGCYFEGAFNWNVLEVAGPGARYNSITNNQFVNCYSLTMVDFDKGASFNLAQGNSVRGGGKSSLWINDVNTRFTVFDDHAGNVPGQWNYGNQFVQNSAQNCSSNGTDPVEAFLGMQWVRGGTYRDNNFDNLNGGRRGFGIYIESNVSRIDVLGNTSKNTRYGISTAVAGTGETGYLNISGNTVESREVSLNIGSGVLAAGWGYGNRIIGNHLTTLSTTVGYCADILQFPGMVIQNNYFQGGGFDCVQINSDGATISGNTATGAGNGYNFRIVSDHGVLCYFTDNRSVSPSNPDWHVFVTNQAFVLFRNNLADGLALLEPA